MLRVLFASMVALAVAPEARAGWPVEIQTYLCWQSTAPCSSANGDPYVFTISRNGTGMTSDGEPFDWSWSSPTLTFEFVQWPASVYTGRWRGNGCFSGTMRDRYGNVGTWSGCRIP